MRIIQTEGVWDACALSYQAMQEGAEQAEISPEGARRSAERGAKAAVKTAEKAAPGRVEN